MRLMRWHAIQCSSMQSMHCMKESDQNMTLFTLVSNRAACRKLIFYKPSRAVKFHRSHNNGVTGEWFVFHLRSARETLIMFKWIWIWAVFPSDFKWFAPTLRRISFEKNKIISLESSTSTCKKRRGGSPSPSRRWRTRYRPASGPTGRSPSSRGSGWGCCTESTFKYTRGKSKNLSAHSPLYFRDQSCQSQKSRKLQEMNWLVGFLFKKFINVPS